MVTQPVEGQPQAEAPAQEAVESQGSFLDDFSVDTESDATSTTQEGEATAENQEETPAENGSYTGVSPSVETSTSAPITTLPTISEESQQRQRMTQLESENRRLLALQAEAQIEEQRLQYQHNLEQQGHGSDAAQVIASNWSDAQKAVSQYKQEVDSQAQEGQAKIQAAQMIATQHGIDAQGLMSYNTPDTMMSAAKAMAENKNLKARLERLEKAQVPPQTFDSSQSAGKSVGRDSLRDRYAEGAELTREELNILFE